LRHVAFYTDAVGWGGAEEMMSVVAASLDEHVTVTVIGTHPDVVARAASTRPGATAVVVPPIATKRALRAMWAHRRALRRLCPQVLHVNLQTPAAARFAVAVAATVPGLSIVVVEHLPTRMGHASTRWFKRVVERRIAAHVAVGSRTALEIETMVGLRPGSVRVIHNGVSCDDAPEAQPRHHAAGSGAVIGTVGRLVPQKAIDVLLRALSELPMVRLEVVGDGPDAADLRRFAAELGVDERVTWHGWSAAPRPVMRGWDAFVLPSRFEGLPVTVLEAMAEGVPVVAAEVGSVGDVVRDGETGWLVPPDDVAALAEAISAAVGHGSAREDVVARAGELVRGEFSVEVMANRYAALYDEVLGT
jgi:glycosyltransferase involved in cell wall biosynthesis